MRAVTIFICVIALTACRKTPDGESELEPTPVDQAMSAVTSDNCDKIVGNWTSDGAKYFHSANISRDGGIYLVRMTQIIHDVPGSGDLKSNWVLSGQCANGIINTDRPSGNISYLPTADNIIVEGNQFSRDRK